MRGKEEWNVPTYNQETVKGSKYFPEAQHGRLIAWVESIELIKRYLDRR